MGGKSSSNMLYVVCFLTLLVYHVQAMGGPSISYSSTHGNYMVLQQSPARAAVYGDILLTHAITLPPKVAVSLVDDDSAITHTVDANVHNPNSLRKEWNFKGLLPAMPAGGSYTITATLSPGVSATLRNVTFGDVWYCAGQSNMALSLENTRMRNVSLSAVQAGHYDHVRLYSLKSPMNPHQPWARAPDIPTNKFLGFSATCWYFGEGLSQDMTFSTIPIGLIHTAVGGTKIEDWLDDDALNKCTDVGPRSDLKVKPKKRKRRRRRRHENRTPNPIPQEFVASVLPFVEMTIKGWVWYQGENDMNDKPTTILGNSLRKQGYACMIVVLVQRFRQLWSATQNTTDPLAPFGIVALPQSGSEGMYDIGTMRWAQTGGYGILPNNEMPNTFLVQSYDVDDPMRPQYRDCYMGGCCGDNKNLVKIAKTPKGCNPQHFPCSDCPRYCTDFCADLESTPWYMGPIHPRTKQTIGNRLGRGAANIDNGAGDEPITGPTLAGCGVDSSNLVTLYFNQTLLRDNSVMVQDYDQSKPMLSKLEVLVDKSLFCMQIVKDKCIDDGYGNSFALAGNTSQGWVPVNIVSGDDYKVVADLTPTSGQAFAIRYAWWGSCCDDDDWTRPCPLGSCPIVSQPLHLPANPFIAKLVDNKCECIPPQVCDYVETSNVLPTLSLSRVQSVNAKAAILLAGLVVAVGGVVLFLVWRKRMRASRVVYAPADNEDEDVVATTGEMG